MGEEALRTLYDEEVLSRRRIRRAAMARRLRALPENKVKDAARHAVRQAVRAGTLTKEPCEVCGSEESEAHHEDYTKALDVIWFCRVHHAQHHGHTIDPEKLAAIKAMLNTGAGVKKTAKAAGADIKLVQSVRRGKYN